MRRDLQRAERASTSEHARSAYFLVCIRQPVAKASPKQVSEGPLLGSPSSYGPNDYMLLKGILFFKTIATTGFFSTWPPFKCSSGQQTEGAGHIGFFTFVSRRMKKTHLMRYRSYF